MKLPGDCLTCANLAVCTETSVKKVLESYTCPLFAPVEEPVYLARLEAMKKFGDTIAVTAMLWDRSLKKEGDSE